MYRGYGDKDISELDVNLSFEDPSNPYGRVRQGKVIIRSPLFSVGWQATAKSVVKRSPSEDKSDTDDPLTETCQCGARCHLSDTFLVRSIWMGSSLQV